MSRRASIHDHAFILSVLYSALLALLKEKGLDLRSEANKVVNKSEKAIQALVEMQRLKASREALAQFFGESRGRSSKETFSLAAVSHESHRRAEHYAKLFKTSATGISSLRLEDAGVFFSFSLQNNPEVVFENACATLFSGMLSLFERASAEKSLTEELSEKVVKIIDAFCRWEFLLGKEALVSAKAGIVKPFVDFVKQSRGLIKDLKEVPVSAVRACVGQLGTNLGQPGDRFGLSADLKKKELETWKALLVEKKFNAIVEASPEAYQLLELIQEFSEKERSRLVQSFCEQALRCASTESYISAREEHYGNTLLHLAVEKKYSALAEWLLDRGADPGAINKAGLRPLDYAFFEPSLEPATQKMLPQSLQRASLKLRAELEAMRRALEHYDVQAAGSACYGFFKNQQMRQERVAEYGRIHQLIAEYSEQPPYCFEDFVRQIEVLASKAHRGFLGRSRLHELSILYATNIRNILERDSVLTETSRFIFEMLAYLKKLKPVPRSAPIPIINSETSSVGSAPPSVASSMTAFAPIVGDQGATLPLQWLAKDSVWTNVGAAIAQLVPMNARRPSLQELPIHLAELLWLLDKEKPLPEAARRDLWEQVEKARATLGASTHELKKGRPEKTALLESWEQAQAILGEDSSTLLKQKHPAAAAQFIECLMAQVHRWTPSEWIELLRLPVLQNLELIKSRSEPSTPPIAPRIRRVPLDKTPPRRDAAGMIVPIPTEQPVMPQAAIGLGRRLVFSVAKKTEDEKDFGDFPRRPSPDWAPGYGPSP